MLRSRRSARSLSEIATELLARVKRTEDLILRRGGLLGADHHEFALRPIITGSSDGYASTAYISVIVHTKTVTKAKAASNATRAGQS